jgi:2-polyprenyl-3-methyl-5-hydroxy-6-metoxy-1,4-benzoquinol methylase
MPDFSTRSTEAEWMDGPVDEKALHRNLKEIHRLNKGMGIYGYWGKMLKKQLKLKGGKRIAELGCGSGLGLIELSRKFEVEPLEWLGIDWNSYLINQAKQNTESGINWIEGDALQALKETDKPVDWAIGTLFLHHIDALTLPNFLAQLKPLVNKGLIFEDLERGPFSYYGFRILSEILGLSAISKHDGALSVLRSFRQRELESVFLQAGWGRIVFHPSFPGRFFICAYHD